MLTAPGASNEPSICKNFNVVYTDLQQTASVLKQLITENTK